MRQERSSDQRRKHDIQPYYPGFGPNTFCAMPRPGALFSDEQTVRHHLADMASRPASLISLNAPAATPLYSLPGNAEK